jgi:hypothetical protein
MTRIRVTGYCLLVFENPGPLTSNPVTFNE